MKNRKSLQSGVIIVLGLIIFVALIISLTIFFPTTKMNVTNSDSRYMSIPTVDAPIVSKTDGTSHDVTTNFSIALDKKFKADVDVELLKSKITEIMENLDYDTVISKGNTEYIKTEITNKLAGQFPEETLKGIYITDINSGDYKFSTNEDTQKTTGRGQVMKGLFKKIN